MMLAHQLIVAAIGLCGFVFLLHVDSVNSLRCKFCHDTGPDCDAGNVPSIECPAGITHCIILIFNSTSSSNVSTYRSCTSNDGTFCFSYATQMYCYIYCNTDDLNSLRCKFCLDTGPDCDSGNVPSIECPDSTMQCIILIFNSTLSSNVTTYRSCTSSDGTFCNSYGPQMYCYIYCNTDDCN